MEGINTVQQIAVILIPGLFAITAHEAAHGWVASRLGDRTALMLGRVTLNPLRHIDPIGTLVVPLVTWLLTGFVFGWAKPVPIDWRNLRNPRRDTGLVALAGPLANLVMAVLWGLAIQLGLALWGSLQWVALPLVYMGAAGVLINVVLMVLNLVPLPPLDGGRILSALLPARAALAYGRVEPYGLIILVALLITGLLGRILIPLVTLAVGLLPGAAVVRELFLI